MPTIYESTVPVLIHNLSNLANLLKKGESYADSKKIDHAILINARLFPDMFPLSKQVQIATDMAKGAAARLGGVDIPKFEDNERTFEELQERISKTIKFIETIKSDLMEGADTRDIEITVRDNVLHFSGKDYLLNWVNPNVYFHVTTAYNILRHNGVEIGKSDFLGLNP